MEVSEPTFSSWNLDAFLTLTAESRKKGTSSCEKGIKVTAKHGPGLAQTNTSCPTPSCSTLPHCIFIFTASIVPYSKMFARSRWACTLLCACLLAIGAFLADHVQAVREHDFKKCRDSSFCRRIRRQSSYVEQWQQDNRKPFTSPYFIPSPSLNFVHSNASINLPLSSALHPDIQFELSLTFFKDGTARVRADQVGERYGDGNATMKPRYGPSNSYLTWPPRLLTLASSRTRMASSFTLAQSIPAH